jgi:predicted anti-sigma-YlaC factor YlaD
MTCAELEILLCDYVDGTLHAADRAALENHLAGCAACKQLAEDVLGATAFMGRAADVNPPAELMTRILHYAPSGRRAAAEERNSLAPSWIKRLFGGFVQNVLQPRYVMGMAMTILSFSMLARFAHIDPRQLRPADLDPVKVWQGIDDRSHRVWDRTMKYYDNLRLVIEVQSRLKEWTDQDPGTASGAGSRNKGSQQ